MRLFLRLISLSLLIGLVSGSAVTLVQRWQVVPLIIAAEAHEARTEALAHKHDDHDAQETASGHHHHENAWKPQDGTERSFWTFVANVLVNIGFAALLLSAIAWCDSKPSGGMASARTGVLWGLAGWFCLFVWPAVGLSPELPGEASAALASRQAWWLFTVMITTVGVAITVFGRGSWRFAGLLLLAVPFLIGAPHVSGPASPVMTPETTEFNALKSQFFLATGIASLIQWIVVGALSGLAVARWLQFPSHMEVHGRRPVAEEASL